MSIYDNHNKTDKNHKILLNYSKNLSLYFKPLNKIFYSEGTVKHSNGISNIIFDLKDKHIRIDSKIKIYRKTFNKKEIILMLTCQYFLTTAFHQFLINNKQQYLSSLFAVKLH